MRTLASTVLALGFVGAMAIGTTIPVMAQGVCKPYRHGPWDIYGGRQSDYGY